MTKFTKQYKNGTGQRKREKERESSQQRLEDFRIHDIISDLVDIGFLDQYSNVADIRCAGKRHIQLTVTEHGGSKVNANVGPGLALGFVDGHGKSKTNRELEPR